MSLNVPLSSNFQIKQTENPLHSSLMGPSEEEVEQIQVGAMKVYRFIVGIDRNIKTMEEGEASCELNDPFANLILKKGLSPLTAGEVVKEFEKTKNLEGGLADFHTFIIAEGGQIPWNEKTQSINRYTRLIFAMTTKKGIGPDVLMSTETDVDSENPFLEVMSWDSKHKAYNFYQRLRASWIWSGNSFFALNDQSRFKGPFSGHTNGGPIMKELREPWQHWSSSSAIIKETAFEPNDPFRNNSYFLKKKNGDQFEQLIRSGIHFWNQSRIEKALQENKIQNPIHLLRQILMTTNVNLVSTIYCSRSLDPSSEVQLPFSFFANLEALSHTGVRPNISPITVKASIYLKSLEQFDFALESNEVRIKGDTHFAFFVPEPAFEDIDLLKKMLKTEIISKHLAACLLMVDFSNPIYSDDRASLQRYIPSTINVGKKGYNLDEQFIANIYKANPSPHPNTPEGQFLWYWKQSQNGADWVKIFEAQMINYFQKVEQLCKTQEGFNRIMELAEYRRYKFKQTAQFEFDLTFAKNNISPEDVPLKMTLKGEIVKMSDNNNVQDVDKN